MKKFEQDYKYLYKQKVEECERLKKERVYEKFSGTAEKILSVEELQKDIEELKNRKGNDDFIVSNQMFKYMFGQCIGAERLERQNKILNRALELACDDTDNYWNQKSATEKKMSLCDYFIQQAKKEMEE